MTSGFSRSAADLILMAQEKPREPVIDPILYEGDILLIHGPEESFKSFLVTGVAISLATAQPICRVWDVPQPRMVGVVNTELHEVALGERLLRMGVNPELYNLRFLDAGGLTQFRRRGGFMERLAFVQQWVTEEGIEVLVIDTVNDFFRGRESPNDETIVGQFFDGLRSFGLNGYLLVRHDHKPKAEDEVSGNPNDRIRGSSEWKEDPEVILSLRREDKRTNKVQLEVGKQRYGQKPEPLKLWFDAGTFGLTPLPPVIALLEHGPQSRQQLLKDAKERFGIGQRKLDEELAQLKPLLTERRERHEKVFEIKWEALMPGDDEEAEAWRQLLVVPERVRDMQSCITLSLH